MTRYKDKPYFAILRNDQISVPDQSDWCPTSSGLDVPIDRNRHSGDALLLFLLIPGSRVVSGPALQSGHTVFPHPVVS